MHALQLLEGRPLIPLSTLGILTLHPTSGTVGPQAVKLKNGS